MCLYGVCACMECVVNPSFHVCWLPLLQGQNGTDDVLACQVDEEGVVNVKDTFNFIDQRGNLIDDPHIEEHNVRT